MEQQRGSVLHCSRFGCIVRLEDGRLAHLPAGEGGIEVVRGASGGGQRPEFPFIVGETDGRRTRVRLAADDRQELEPRAATPSSGKLSSSLEQKIIDFWRQTAGWGRNAGRVETAQAPHSDRLVRFAMRA